MKSWAYVAYGAASYALFLAVYAWFCGFTGGLWLSHTIDGPARGSWQAAVAVDLLLMLAFGLQHSVMARPAFKRVWTQIVPQPIERSTYVFISSVALAAMIWFWQPVTTVVWNVESTLGRSVMWTLFAVGWLMVPTVSHMINHYDLFGLRQVWLHRQGKEYTLLPFKTPYLYAYIRHPLYVGWALAFWATPRMTAGHLLMAVVLTGYMMLAAIVEERDLIASFGRQYEEYQRRTPKFIPRVLRPRHESVTTIEAAPSQPQ